MKKLNKIKNKVHFWKKDKIVREFAWQTHSTCECDENATGKQTQRKVPGQQTKNSLTPKTIETREIKGEGLFQSCPKRRDKENPCAGAEGELKEEGSTLNGRTQRCEDDSGWEQHPVPELDDCFGAKHRRLL